MPRRLLTMFPFAMMLVQSERAEARRLGLPSRIDPDRATGVDFDDRHVSLQGVHRRDLA